MYDVESHYWGINIISFPLHKTHGLGTFPKCRVGLIYCLIQSPLFWKCPHPWAHATWNTIFATTPSPSWPLCPIFMFKLASYFHTCGVSDRILFIVLILSWFNLISFYPLTQFNFHPLYQIKIDPKLVLTLISINLV